MQNTHREVSSLLRGQQDVGRRALECKPHAGLAHGSDLYGGRAHKPEVASTTAGDAGEGLGHGWSLNAGWRGVNELGGGPCGAVGDAHVACGASDVNSEHHRGLSHGGPEPPRLGARLQRRTRAHGRRRRATLTAPRGQALHTLSELPPGGERLNVCIRTRRRRGIAVSGDLRGVGARAPRVWHQGLDGGGGRSSSGRRTGTHRRLCGALGDGNRGSSSSEDVGAGRRGQGGERHECRRSGAAHGGW